MGFDRYSSIPLVGCVLSLIAGCQASSSALVIPPSQYFEGNDGPWSSFNVRVGSPEQDARVLISTASPETLVVLSQYGCSEAVMEKVPSDCAVSRGIMFTPNESSTWYQLGKFGINGGGVGLEANLGYVQPALFGLDTLGIGLVDGSGGHTLKNQTIGGIGTAYPFYLGTFGINTQPLNFSSLGNFSAPSYVTSLKEKNVIPSLSWSYTAGAIYRLKKVYGQLIFSGYDTSRFTDNAATFTMADDITRDLVVALQAITYSGENKESLLSSPINIYIDSTDPNIWLPDDAVDAFESAFGLTLDDTSGLYLVNASHQSILLESNAQVSFRLSDVLDGGDSAIITLPYNAFNLQAEYPLVENSSYYFPLKRAANESQYTLGRTFLQEAYLTADYERRVFNVSQCTWDEGAEENIVTISARSDTNTNEASSPGSKIPKPPSSDNADDSDDSSLGAGVIAGIVIGAVVGVALIALAVFFFLRRRKQDPSNEGEQSILPSPGAHSVSEFDSKQADGNLFAIPPTEHGELSGNDTQIYQLHADSGMSAIRGRPEIYELPGMGIPQPAELSERDTESPAASAISLASPMSFPSPSISPDVSRTSTQRL
ncbi:Peptidase aspartic catalytic [Penicillium concentricum]|uniref:Peptidase aspartic catalytic n=1 Tax=Penicillium concentricum TaxID=293559 RepID=A0A9W9RAU7_9EURO|nr:Peptidase aspartic catalytic [Penicillium concentricum]KAJ5356781.1 Peptidase aspartic catalytic [Penicillium concentricum]